MQKSVENADKGPKFFSDSAVDPLISAADKVQDYVEEKTTKDQRSAIEALTFFTTSTLAAGKVGQVQTTKMASESEATANKATSQAPKEASKPDRAWDLSSHESKKQGFGSESKKIDTERGGYDKDKNFEVTDKNSAHAIADYLNPHQKFKSWSKADKDNLAQLVHKDLDSANEILKREFGWELPKEVLEKIPPEMRNNIQPNKKTVGFKWFEYSEKGNTRHSIRIDMGDPKAQTAAQRVDHVSITRNGEKLDHKGQAITSSNAGKVAKVEHAHVKVTEWTKWKDGLRYE